MRIMSVIRKSLLEQVRSVWLLILAVTMVPFFVFVYYVISESYQPRYKVLVINQDLGIMVGIGYVNLGQELVKALDQKDEYKAGTRLLLEKMDSREEGEKRLRSRTADMLVIIPQDFSSCLTTGQNRNLVKTPEVEFAGDLTNMNYLVAAIWVEDYLYRFTEAITSMEKPFRLKETSIGVSGDRSEFELYVPGLIILSTIMLMFTAAIAFVAESEKQTLIRLKMSKLSTMEYLAGVSIVQTLVGVAAVVLTLVTSVSLGFRLEGSPWLFLLIVILCSVSLIAFSIIVAGFTRSVNEVLIVGNFPMFIFMFFTGAAFPMRAHEFFHVGNYGISVMSLLSPSHAVSALNKVLIMKAGFCDIVPELTCMVILTLVYFAAGAWIFRRRHMKAQ
jgi:ABC-2 type transport system permease protein